MNNPFVYQIIVYTATPYIGSAVIYVSKMVVTRVVSSATSTIWRYITTPKPTPPPPTPPTPPTPPPLPTQTPPTPPEL